MALDSRSDLKSIIRDYARLAGQDVADFLANLPSEQIRHKTAKEIRMTINNLGPKDVYLLRETACELYTGKAAETQGLVDEVFSLTHFLDDLPSQNNIDQAKRLILENL